MSPDIYVRANCSVVGKIITQDEKFPIMDDMSLVLRHFGVSDQVRHKPGCTTTQDVYGLEMSYLRSSGIVLSM